MTHTLRQYAEWYHDNKKWSVIPVRQDKKPYVQWTEYQSNRANLVQIRKWWTQWPDANIGIVTGPVSKIMVVDVDSQKGHDALNEFLPDTFLTPIATTPGGGWHYYFDYRDGLVNRARVITDCDVRTVGGYIVAPPSVNGNGKAYAWVDGFKINQIKNPVAMPEMLFDILSQGKKNPLETLVLDTRGVSSSCRQVSSSVVIEFTKGNRDESLFHIANCLAKGGMSEHNAFKTLCFIANQLEPANAVKWAKEKVSSAFQRSENSDRNLTDEVKDYVLSSSGDFLSSDVVIFLGLSSRVVKKNVSKILGRMVIDRIIERTGKKNGQFRRIENEAPEIDYMNADTNSLPIKYPLDVHEFYRTMSKNIIIIAGTQDVGKTAFLLRFTQMNMNRGMPIRYQSSEMGAAELRSRLELFEDTPLKDWRNVDFRERSTNFQDLIQPDAINIIDYLEISDNFYMIAGFLKEIFDRLDKGIAVVALQKDTKTDLGRGGTFSLEKPRLYLSLTANPPEGNVAKIVKCKNWAHPKVNPNGRTCVFKVVQGNEIKRQIDWIKPGGKI